MEEQSLPLLDRGEGEAGEARSGLVVGVPARRTASILGYGSCLCAGDSVLAGLLSPSGSGRTRLTSAAGSQTEQREKERERESETRVSCR